MDAVKTSLVRLVCSFALVVVLLHTQSQSDHISIDCGSKESYKEKEEMPYDTDADYIDTGKNREVDPKYKHGQYAKQLWTLREFPEGKRNCYNLTLKAAKGNKYLIRVSFFYGNYDLMGKPPSFDVHVGPNVWLRSLMFENESAIITEEIIHVASRDDILVCLVNTGFGTPFISYLEHREFSANIPLPPDLALWLNSRLDSGSPEGQQAPYKDVLGREWKSHTLLNWESITTPQAIDPDGNDDSQPPSRVMQTAARPRNASEPLHFTFVFRYSTERYAVRLHFAEIQKLRVNQSREFRVFVNGISPHGPFTPKNLFTLTVPVFIDYDAQPTNISIERTKNSTLPPIINAIETFMKVKFPFTETSVKEVNAIHNIKKNYKMKKNWQGDPCVPKGYRWDGLNCSYNGSEAPKITHLNLSSSRLKGKIISDIAELTSLQSLDLSDNNLSGMLPPYFSQLSSLEALYLNGNNLTGPIPDELVKRYRSKSLDLRVDENLKDYLYDQHGKKNDQHDKNKIIISLVASITSVIFVLTTLTLLWCYKSKKHEELMAIELKNRQLTYAEVLKTTNNFDRVLGKGGFGSVYYGLLEDVQVAVKVLSPSSIQGHKQFLAEVKLLTRVHHKNLTTLIGYCNHGTKLALLYEYMINGDLKSHLSEGSAHILSWERRLRVAVDTAQGLEYLHHGCKPPIIHRDIKSTNILLDEKFQAKLADFGLSKFFSNEGECTNVTTDVVTRANLDTPYLPNESGASYISTAVAGTPGYLDPGYFVSNRLNEKSDVYSFGVVLLELVSSKPVVMSTVNEKTHISEWVRFMLAKGDLENIVDPRMQGECDINSVKKALEVALSCITFPSHKRPSMNEVATELKACLKMELLRKQEHDENEVQHDEITLSTDTDTRPLAR